MSGGAAYFDASAFAKLLKPEPESEALERMFGDWPGAVASELLEIEVRRVARRLRGRPVVDLDAVLERFSLLPIDRDVRRLAAAVDPTSLATLDAIHLATALSLGSELEVFVAYDRRLLRAARAAGLNVLAPA